jgi:hypothetical protein
MFCDVPSASVWNSFSIVVGVLDLCDHPAAPIGRVVQIHSAPIGSHASSPGCERRRSFSCSWRTVCPLLAFVVLATGILTQLSPRPADAAIRPPEAAWSYYVRTTRPQRLLRLGCQQGLRIGQYGSLQDTIVVLDFGRPVHMRRHRRGRAFGPFFYGVSLFRKRGFVTVEAVREASQAYAQGVLNCTKGRWDIHVRIAIGTSNWGAGVSWGHGRAWAMMVNEANDWIRTRGFSRKIDFAGANDIELSWNRPRVTRKWVNGYESAAMYPYYNYGAADACPPRGDCAGAWTVEDVWYVSWAPCTRGPSRRSTHRTPRRPFSGTTSPSTPIGATVRP